MKCSLYEMTQYVISLYNRFDECIYCKKDYNPRITLSATTLRDYISHSRGVDKFVREGGGLEFMFLSVYMIV